ncbi:hypothetical protein GOBAR_AA10877 [Gossypium barbadense]|uniref:Dehydrogenase E1 component domain-containing protein n=1 Tax=Gossypium barbadense TaxID=3634 RepID=A0A2P5Y2K2_GOSBA|nr:hypothetical protein GOBAR_AA10877 [Gossypium barbadense]
MSCSTTTIATIRYNILLVQNLWTNEPLPPPERGEGPTLVECETYRFKGHSLADLDELCDPVLKYCLRVELINSKAYYAVRDPITALKKYLIENRLASETDLKAIDKKIDDVVEEAIKFADESPDPPRSRLLENVFADLKGFEIEPDDRYRFEDPKFTKGTAQV